MGISQGDGWRIFARARALICLNFSFVWRDTTEQKGSSTHDRTKLVSIDQSQAMEQSTRSFLWTETDNTTKKCILLYKCKIGFKAHLSGDWWAYSNHGRMLMAKLSTNEYMCEINFGGAIRGATNNQ